MYLPNYCHSSYNAICSILKYYGVENPGVTLTELDIILKKKRYRNIVYFLLDGMGNSWLEKHFKNSFLYKKRAGILSTVFPSTTTAAMTVFYSGLAPVSHGWLGWRCYFKEENRQIELFTNRDYQTGEKCGREYLKYIAYDDIFTRIKAVNQKVDVYSVYPSLITAKYNSVLKKINSFDELLSTLVTLDEEPKEKFVLAYYPSPDDLMHEYGPNDEKVVAFMRDVDQKIADLYQKLGSDTLIIISADHGQVEIEKNYYLNDYPDVLETLERLPSIEPRALSFNVKKDHEEKFKRLFNQYFGNDFHLFTREEVLKLQLFGPTTPHPKTLDFLGDFLAVGIKNALLDYRYSEVETPKFKGHHAGLKIEEMEVPFIILNK